MKVALHYIFRCLLIPIGVLFLPTIGLGQNNRSLSFTDFGPVAFDSFWLLPAQRSYDKIGLQLNSRKTSDHLNGDYFTQYLRLDIPIGAKNGLSVRFPWHHFSLDPTTADEFGMAQSKGAEWGDIDITFTINTFRKFFQSKANGRFAVFLTGEMHTAPTNRGNRQFTDTIKLLGLVNSEGSWVINRSMELDVLLSLGMGGWQDDVLPRQNHIVKVASNIELTFDLNNKGKVSAILGQTLLSGEKENDEGIHVRGGFSYEDGKFRKASIMAGRIDYTESMTGYSQIWELILYTPIILFKQKNE